MLLLIFYTAGGIVFSSAPIGLLSLGNAALTNIALGEAKTAVVTVGTIGDEV